jgi:hypothetical protein
MFYGSILWSIVTSDRNNENYLVPHGSAFIWLFWIQIRIGNADLDPDTGAWKLTKIYK